jgi:hypothetical protein
MASITNCVQIATLFGMQRGFWYKDNQTKKCLWKQLYLVFPGKAFVIDDNKDHPWKLPDGSKQLSIHDV